MTEDTPPESAPENTEITFRMLMEGCNDMNSELADYIQDIVEFGTFFAQFFSNQSSVTGNELHPVLHGYIYKTLSRKSKEIVLWGLQKNEREQILHFYAEKSKIVGSKIVVLDPGEEFVDSFHYLINLSGGRRGSIAFVLKKGSLPDIEKILELSDFIGRMSSMNQVIDYHSRASVNWALDQARCGGDICMIGGSSGPKKLDCFFSAETTEAAILGLHKYEKDKVR